MIKKRKAQATIFIIIAIVLVAGVIIFFLVRQSILMQEVSSETQPIYSFVEDCIQQTGIEIVYKTVSGGGYYFPTNFSTDSGVPIYYFDGKSYIPTKKQIENEISYFTNEKLFFCTRNFVNFPDFEIKQGEIKTETKIQSGKIILDVNYPLTITKGEKTTSFKRFKDIEIPVRLGIIYDSIYNLTQEQLTSNAICLTCLSEITSKNDLYVDMMDYDDEIVLFSFRDENSKINNESLEFIYANKFKIK